MYLELKADDKKHAILMYLKVLVGFHKLTEREMETFAEIIEVYLKIQTRYDKELADKMYLNTESRKGMMKTLGMDNHVFRNYVYLFKRLGLIKQDGLINPLYLADYSKNEIHITITCGKDEDGR
jgi:hypothetical protein